MKTISSRANPLVKAYRDVAAGRVSSLVLLDGAHLIGEAAHAGLRVTSVACSPRGAAQPAVRALLERVESAGGRAYSVSEDVLKAMSPVRSPAGLVALAERPTWSLSRVFRAAPADMPSSQAAPQLVVISVDVQDPGNVGAIVRAAEAGGATAAAFVGATADPFAWKALRGSMGSALRLPIALARTEEVLAAARAADVRLVATAPRDGRSMFDANLRGPIALLLGGEGPGLPRDLIDVADEVVSIPMHAPVESLNVAVAAALLIYEASRQRARP